MNSEFMSLFYIYSFSFVITFITTTLFLEMTSMEVVFLLNEDGEEKVKIPSMVIVQGAIYLMRLVLSTILTVGFSLEHRLVWLGFF